jgi:hypothetical protein
MDPLASYRPFIECLASAQAEGNFEHVEANLDRLRAVIAELMDYTYHLARLQAKASEILDRHG